MTDEWIDRKIDKQIDRRNVTADFRIHIQMKIPFQPQSFLVPPLHPLPSPVRILCATRLLQSSPVQVPCRPQPLSVIPCTPSLSLSLFLSLSLSLSHYYFLKTNNDFLLVFENLKNVNIFTDTYMVISLQMYMYR